MFEVLYSALRFSKKVFIKKSQPLVCLYFWKDLAFPPQAPGDANCPK